MNYNLDLGEWGGVFAVPNSVVDKQISKLSFDQLKVLLWVLRNSSGKIEVEKACNELEITREKFDEVFIYWKDRGVFSNKNSGIEFNEKDNIDTPPVSPVSKKPLEMNLKKVYFRNPDSSYVASRIGQSTEISFLMNEAQNMLGRPISSSDCSVLLMLHDSEGLPVNVILMLIQYAVSIGKAGLRYIQATGINWAKSGIDSVEKAESKIQSLNHVNILWNQFQNLIGLEKRLPTSYEEEILIKWYDNWKLPNDLIKYAYEICVDSKGKYAIRYMDGILKKWYAQNVCTMEQAKKVQSVHRTKRAQIKETSYDMEWYENYDIFSEK